MAGLGVVVSKYAAHDLDTSLLVTVIPDDKWEDIEYVQMKLIENRKISVTMKKCNQYGIDNFSWQKLVKTYVENIEGYGMKISIIEAVLMHTTKGVGCCRVSYMGHERLARRTWDKRYR